MKKWLKSILLVVFVISTLGGCSMNQNDKNISQSEQDRVISYFMNNYRLNDNSTIEKIEVVEFEKDVSSQTWLITLKVNNLFLISFAENQLGDELRSSNYSPKEFCFRDKENESAINKKNIDIIYSGGTNE